MKEDTIQTLFRQKKGYTLESFLFVFLFLGGFLALGITGYRQHLKQICDTWYGTWDAVVYGAEDTLYGDLQGHAAVEETGRMELWGYVLDSEAKVCGSLGCADEALISMGEVELEEGRLPERENEIALDSSMLLKLGYEKKLGQEIELKVVETPTYGKAGSDAKESQLAVKRYYLIGIVNNYSAYWQEDGEWPISCFIWKDKDYNLPPVRIHLYLSFKPQYASYRRAVETVCYNRGRWQINKYRETESLQAVNTRADCYTVYHLLLYGLLFLSGITYLFYVLVSELGKNRELYRCLQFLGMGKKEFFQQCLQMKWKRIVTCCFAGCFTGMVTSILFEVVIRPYGEVGLSELYDVKSVLINLPMVLVGTLVLIAMIVCFDYSITRFGGGTEKKPHGKYRRKKKFSVSRCFHFFLGKKRQINGGLLCVVTMLILICVNTSWMFFRDYKYNLKNYPYDYIFGGHTNYNRDPYTVSKKELSELYGIKGITDISSYSIDVYETVSYDTHNLSTYEYYVDRNGIHMQNTSLSRNSKKIIMGMSDGLIDTYQKDLELDTDLYQAGGIILYVPDLYQFPDGQMGSELWMRSNCIDLNGSIEKFRDEIIKTGDTIQVELGGKEVNLRVAGILRQVEDNVPRFMITMAPYSIICSYDVYETLFGEEVGYSCVMLNTDDNSFQTDLELSKTSAGYRFQNYRSQRNQILTECILYLVLSVFLTESVVFLAISGGWKSRDGNQRQLQNRMYQFHILGMSLGEMKREIRREDRKDSLVCILLADGMFMIAQWIINLMRYRECVDDSLPLYRYDWDYVFSITVSNINFPLLFVVSLFLYLLFRMLQCRNMRRMLKEIAEKCG
ncbi:MAG: hypothetical protein MR487_03550 [Lachnospiraceae bacterium]|nr:hypothetical protein [Lachnospiraceae bacterium]